MAGDQRYMRGAYKEGRDGYHRGEPRSNSLYQGGDDYNDFERGYARVLKRIPRVAQPPLDPDRAGFETRDEPSMYGAATSAKSGGRRCRSRGTRTRRPRESLGGRRMIEEPQTEGRKPMADQARPAARCLQQEVA